MNIAIIGGGASGFMAAITAAEAFPDHKVFIFEKNRTVLNKVRVSGGGRCNVTNRPAPSKSFSANYPRGEKFLRKLLDRFGPSDTVTWFDQRGVKLKTEPDGRMFPVTDNSQTITECLVRTARNLGISIRTSIGVQSFAYEGGAFTLHLEDGELFSADRLLISTGGHPKPSGYAWLHDHGQEIVDPLPSLFTFNMPGNYLLALAGVSVDDALVRIAGTKHEWRGPLLITHWGLSGPAVLKLSAWAARDLAEKNYQFTCRVSWIPEWNEEKTRAFLIEQKKETPRQLVVSHARFGLPNRLWRTFCAQAGILEELRWQDAAHKPLNRLAEILTNSQFQVDGKTTFKEEFVTCGGISLDQFDHQTMESKAIPGLFYAGEVIDVDGITGGFNFQNAWTTGFVAGSHIGQPRA